MKTTTNDPPKPTKLVDTAMLIATLTFLAFFYAWRYLAGYLHYFGAETHWFELTLSKIITFGWINPEIF